jgi:hypothetical protein
VVPFSTEWVSEGRGVHLAGTGPLTGQEILDAKPRLFRARDRLKSLHYWLIDVTDVTELSITRDDVLEFVQVDMQIALIVPRPLAVAIVAPSDLAFGIARMWHRFAEVTRWNTHVFRSREEADPWLRPWAEGRLPAEPSS